MYFDTKASDENIDFNDHDGKSWSKNNDELQKYLNQFSKKN